MLDALPGLQLELVVDNFEAIIRYAIAVAVANIFVRSAELAHDSPWHITEQKRGIECQSGRCVVRVCDTEFNALRRGAAVSGSSTHDQRDVRGVSKVECRRIANAHHTGVAVNGQAAVGPFVQTEIQLVGRICIECPGRVVVRPVSCAGSSSIA